MYSGKEERAEFSKRLVLFLVRLGWTKISPTRLAENYNTRAGPTGKVTVHAVRKWLIGEAIPTQARIATLASWLRVTPEELRFGKTIAPLEVEDVTLPELSLLKEFAQLDSAKKKLVRELVTLLGKQTN